VDRPQGCENHIFIYNVRGQGWLNLAGRRLEVPPEHACLIPAGLPHVYGSDEAIPWEIYWVHFGGERAGEVAALLELSVERPLLYLPAADVLTEAFEDVYRWTREGFSDGALVALAAELKRFFSLVNVHRRSPGDKSRQAEERILRVMRRMHERLAEPSSLEDWAGDARLSVPHFSALFRKQAGSSPMRFLLRLRLQKACELLDLTGEPVKAVARLAGFEDPLYFSRQFRKVVGVAPREYRHRVKG
jgi:AraC-like DNA-binding protein